MPLLKGANVSLKNSSKGTPNGIELTSSKPFASTVCYILLLIENSEVLNNWKLKLDKYQFVKTDDVHEVWAPETYLENETCIFLNAFLHRLWMNLRDSDRVLKKFQHKIYSKLYAKIVKKD